MTAPAAPKETREVGRPRDERASAAITAAALRQLHEVGYSHMSMETVAAEAGVARATLYRRFSGKADLVTAAVAQRVDTIPTAGDDPMAELAKFLEEFDSYFAETCLELIGCLLAAREDLWAMALHRERVVGPRLAWVRRVLERARERGDVAEDVDIDLALQMLVGSVFARRVAGVSSQPGWARRAIDQACGVQPRAQAGADAHVPVASAAGA
jgi:AcrR family transcriptional regulator